MLLKSYPVSVLLSSARKCIWKDSIRSCQTAFKEAGSCKEAGSHKEADSCKAETTDDPDMFISDIQNPYEKKPRQCIICKYNIPLDYRNPKLLSQFVSSYTGFIYDKHITGLCEAQQIRLVKAIQKSRAAGFMAYLLKSPQYLRDPKLYDPFSPSRKNKY